MIENLFTFVRTLGNQRIEGKKFFVGQVGVLGTLSDETGSIGSYGDVLSSTETGVRWIAAGSAGATYLDDLLDVVIDTPSSGQILRYGIPLGSEDAIPVWYNWTPSYLTPSSSIDNLSDVSITTPTTGQLLRWNGSSWVNWTPDFISSEVDTLQTVTTRGAVTNLGITTAGVTTDFVDFKTSPSINPVQGSLFWNADDSSLNLQVDNDVALKIGQDNTWFVKNQTGSTISKGTVVMAAGTTGASGRITVAPMIADGTVSSKYLLGVAAEDILDGNDGFVINIGKLKKLDTSGFTQGDVLWCDPSTPGALTSVEPSSPSLKLPIAFVVNSHVNNGVIAVRINTGFKIEELHNVQVSSASNNDAIIYDSASGVWQNKQLSYTHIQSSASSVWTITHNLNKFPSVTVVDSANNLAIGSVEYVTASQLIVYFSSPFSGKAYLN